MSSMSYCFNKAYAKHYPVESSFTIIIEAPRRTQISSIQANFFRNFTHSRIFFSSFKQTRFFRKIRNIFREKSGNIWESGKFVHNRGNRENSRIHVKNRADSRIYAIKKWIFTFTQVFSIHAFTLFFFQFSRIRATKKAHSRIHANRWGAIISF